MPARGPHGIVTTIRRLAAELLIAFRWHARAIAILERLRQEGGDDPDLAALLAFAYGESGRWREAADEFERLVALESQDAALWCNLGLCYQELRRYSDAVEAYRKAISMKPELTDAHLNLGLAWVQLGKHVDAAAAFEAAARHDSDNPDIIYNMALSYVDSGRLDEARKLQARLMDLDEVLGAELARRLEGRRPHEQ
jgi:Flp pilus assembly protein TadD